MELLLLALLILSLFIVCLLAWLGGTVLLTAERRTIHVWLVSLAMLLGAVFIAFHAAMLSHGLATGNPFTLTKWPLIWVAGLLLPGAWYMAVLWHVGFWENRRALRHYRLHTIGFLRIMYLVCRLRYHGVSGSWNSRASIAITFLF